MNLAGGWGWAALLGILVFTPMLDILFDAIGLPWLAPIVTGALVGLLLWNVWTALRGTSPVSAGRTFSPQWVRVLTGGALIALAAWDPMGFLPMGAHFLAGGGFLEGALVRLAEGVLVLAGFMLVWTGLWPTEAHVARKQAAVIVREKKQERKDAKRAPSRPARPPRP